MNKKQKCEMRDLILNKHIDPINPLFKKYDRFEGEELAAEVNKDYSLLEGLNFN